ncbi:MAG: restriction endonuclease subunit S [Desulfobacterales bacterium]|nr:restriction endonuclease subunit S [Desulfobacterales bacterium]
MPDWKHVKITFPTEKLEKFIEPVKRTVQETKGKDYNTVYGVTNIEGITVTGKKASNDISNYITIDEGCFAYNPYRINVGSIGFNNSNIKGCVSPAYVVFRTRPSFSSEFLFLYLKSDFGNHLINWYGNRGGVRNALRYDDLCKIDVPKIDYKEQIVLVNKIQKARTTISAFNSSVDDQLSLLKKLRQQILQEAVEGKLTEDWRKKNPKLISGDNHASKLLEKIKAEKEQLIKEGKIKKDKPLQPITDTKKPFDLPEGWVWCRLGDVAFGFEYGSSAKSSKEGKIPVLRMGNIQNGRIEWEDLVYSSNASEIKKHLLKCNDLLFNRTNSRELVGKTALYESDEKTIYAGYIVRFHMHGNIMPQYTNFIMNSSFHRSWCNEVKADALGQSNINATKLRDYRYPLAPIAEQQNIVERVDKLMIMIDELEKQVTERKDKSERLMQSVLREAFMQ